MKILYTTQSTSSGGREGHSRSIDGILDVTLTTPKELGGDGKPGTNPEQLFGAGYSACFLGALKFVGGKAHVKIPADAKVTAEVGIGARDDGGGFGLEVELVIDLPGLEKPVVEDLVAKADVVCPYSHSIRGNVPVKLTVA